MHERMLLGVKQSYQNYNIFLQSVDKVKIQSATVYFQFELKSYIDIPALKEVASRKFPP